MNDLIEKFPAMLKDAMQIGSKANLTPLHKDIRNVVIAGLGGSGIGGNLVSELVEEKIKVPVTVCKDYHIPSYVTSHTLFIACSYSGNTEETIHAMEEAIKHEAKIVCITSGGSMQRIAEKAGLDCILIPGGMPPRACLAYSAVQQLYVLYNYKLIDSGFEAGLDSTAKLLTKESARIQKLALKIAKKLNKKMPVIYAPANMEAVAVRLRQQLNENSKVLAWHHVIPEMNHNELVGWRTKGKYAVVMLRNDNDYVRNAHRFDIAKGIISEYTKTLIEVFSKGDSNMERSFYFIYLGDWISYHLAKLRDMDPVEVKVIDYLKAELAN